MSAQDFEALEAVQRQTRGAGGHGDVLLPPIRIESSRSKCPPRHELYPNLGAADVHEALGGIFEQRDMDK